MFPLGIQPGLAKEWKNPATGQKEEYCKKKYEKYIEIDFARFH